MGRRKKKDIFKGWTTCPCGMRVPPMKVCPICTHDGSSLIKAAIAVDKWKLRTFIEVLTRDGFEFAKGDGLTPGTSILYVMTKDLEALRSTVTTANRKCAELKN